MKKVLLGLGLSSILVLSLANATVYATVDGEEITDKDLIFLKQAMPDLDFNALPQDVKEKAIDQAIERKLLTIEAKKDKLEDTPEFKEALEAFKDNMTLELWMRKQIEKVKVSESDMKKFYNDNKSKMIIPESATAKHILVSSEKEAKEIIKELDKAGKNAEAKFIELAKSKSQDPSAQNGGNLGTFTREQMDPEFSKAAFGLKNKTYTKLPVKTQFGYHVIFLDSKKPQESVSFEDAKPRIEQELQLVKFRDVIANKYKELKKKAKISINK